MSAGPAGRDWEWEFSAAPRGPLSAILLRCGFLARIGRMIDRLFRQAAGCAEASREDAFRSGPPAIAASIRQSVAIRARMLADQGYGAAERLAAHLLEAAETDLERLRPRALARRWDVEQRAAIETRLAAAREGLLIQRWDLICPRCRGAKVSVTSLDQFPQGAHCPSCNIDYARDFSRNVEVTFEPDPSIRALGAGTYCLASPLASEHILVQRQLASGEEATLAVELADGDYRARTIEPGGAVDFRVASRQLPEISLGADTVRLQRSERRSRCGARHPPRHRRVQPKPVVRNRRGEHHSRQAWPALRSLHPP
jgi:uncharacterized protein DUF5939